MEMKLSEVVAAAERGEAIQIQCHQPHGVWQDKEPTTPWYPSYAYRLKPKPLECWVNFYSDGNSHAHFTEPQARAMASIGATRIAVRMTLVEVV